MIYKPFYWVKVLLAKIYSGDRGEFWFTNASMDFFDFFFKYGAVGTIIFIMILSRISFKSFINSHIRDKIAITLFIAYSFGGHVIDSVTSVPFLLSTS